MRGPDEWSREFSTLEEELDKLSRKSAEEWAGEFSELEAELRSFSISAEPDLSKLAPDRLPDNTKEEAGE